MDSRLIIGPDGQPTRYARAIEAYIDAEIQRLDQQTAQLRRRRDRAIRLRVADILDPPTPNPVQPQETE